MAKLDWVDQRLERWAEWTARGGSTSGGTLSMFRGQPSDCTRALAGLSLDEAECWRTGEDIKALPEPLPLTVAHYYLSGSHAAQDRLCISRDVLAKRITRAHQALASAWLSVGPSETQLPRGF